VINDTLRELQPREKSTGNNCTEGRVGTRAKMDGLGKIKSLYFLLPNQLNAYTNSIASYHTKRLRHYCAISREILHEALKLAKIQQITFVIFEYVAYGNEDRSVQRYTQNL